MFIGDQQAERASSGLRNAGEAYVSADAGNRQSHPLPVGGGFAAQSAHDNTEEAVPELSIKVFGAFEVLVGGKPVADPTIGQRRVRLLLGILAVNQGKELHCDYLASSIWPDSSYEKRRKGFYNIWWMLTKAICAEGASCDRYLQRRHLSCGLLENYVKTDAARILAACDVLASPALDPEMALEAYRLLQDSYRGELMPGENENPIILRAREEWRDHISDSLFIGANRLRRQMEHRSALWLAQAGCRVDPFREDMLRLRMRILIDCGRPAAALHAYNDARALFESTVGVPLSEQTDELYKEIVGFKPVRFEMPISQLRRGSHLRSQALARIAH